MGVVGARDRGIERLDGNKPDHKRMPHYSFILTFCLQPRGMCMRMCMYLPRGVTVQFKGCMGCMDS